METNSEFASSSSGGDKEHIGSNEDCKNIKKKTETSHGGYVRIILRENRSELKCCIEVKHSSVSFQYFFY